MADEKLKMDPVKGKELQASLLKLKQELGNINQQITQAINLAGQTWRDFKYNDFKETYRLYQAGITKFENDLEKVAKVTLPPLIQEAEEIAKMNLTGA